MGPRRLASAVALALLAFAAPSASAAVHLTPIADFSLPVHVAAPPGDPHRLFVVEQGGRIMEVRDGQKLATPFLDNPSHVPSGGEQGLLSMAFSPFMTRSRKFSVFFPSPPLCDSRRTVIAA